MSYFDVHSSRSTMLPLTHKLLALKFSKSRKNLLGKIIVRFQLLGGGNVLWSREKNMQNSEEITNEHGMWSKARHWSFENTLILDKFRQYSCSQSDCRKGKKLFRTARKNKEWYVFKPSRSKIYPDVLNVRCSYQHPFREYRSHCTFQPLRVRWRWPLKGELMKYPVKS